MNAMVSENGGVEIVQFFITLLGSILGLFSVYWALKNRAEVWLLIWCLCFSLGCFYIAGEEISWGQWIFYWKTPEAWSLINDQGETNIHNISSWFDQKPKILILFGILVGGMMCPLLEKYTRFRLPEYFRIIYPPHSLFFIALCLLIVKIKGLMSDFFSLIPFWTRGSEIEELYIYYYLLLYLVVLCQRVRG